MLQYLTQDNGQFSIIEQCQMVIEGGCGWIQLHTTENNDSELGDILNEIIPLCKESSTILTIEDRPDIAKSYGIHGIHLTIESKFDVRQVREEVGPEAIIGMTVISVDQIMNLRGVDIDYISIPFSLGIERCGEIISASRSEGIDTPMVIIGDIKPENIPSILKSGASGICTGREIAKSRNPVAYTENLLCDLNPQ